MWTITGRALTDRTLGTIRPLTTAGFGPTDDR
jgi:hypothetical protein